MKQALFISSIALLVTTQALASSQCLTHREARAKYPHERLWRTKGCWHLEVKTEQAATETQEAQILFPSLTKANPLETYPRLIMQQPWLTQESIVHWPLLIDVDRVPFTAWNKRIGE